MGTLEEVIQYYKFLMTTKVSYEELNTIIRQVERGMKDYDISKVVIEVNRKGIRAIVLTDAKIYPNGNGKGDNGNGHNG